MDGATTRTVITTTSTNSPQRQNSGQEISLSSKPIPHWFVHDTGPKYVPLEDATSAEIEQKWLDAGGAGWVLVDNFRFKVNFAKATMKNVKDKKKKKLRRGTWFWQDDDGSWAPYEAEICDKLETAFQTGNFKTIEVCHKPPRIITHLADGSFRQLRKTKGGNAAGRAVTRGYQGATEEKILQIPQQEPTTVTTTNTTVINSPPPVAMMPQMAVVQPAPMVMSQPVAVAPGGMMYQMQ